MSGGDNALAQTMEKKREELSYLDLINKLHEDVQSDPMPKDVKREVNKHLESLLDLLWAYSA